MNASLSTKDVDSGNSAAFTHAIWDSGAVRPGQLGIGVLFWTIRDAAVVADTTTGRIVLWNPAAQQLFGWSEAEAIGALIELLIPERLRGAHRAGLVRYLETGSGSIIDGRCPVQVPGVRSDGVEITIELSMTPLIDQEAPAQDRRYVLALIRDASERTRLAAEREALLSTTQDYVERLEELAALKADFTTIVAHELAGPLAAIRALAEILDLDRVPPAGWAGPVAAIKAEVRMLQTLVADVQTAAAIERKDEDFVVRPRSVPIDVLMAEAAAYARTLPGDHPLTVGDPVGTRVFADPERIGQVLRNLLGNAAKHTPPGTPITLRAIREQGHVRVEITDSGPGIDPADQAQIFEKFGRVYDQGHRQVDGRGLGLYLSRRILELHGAELTVTSALNEGAAFSFVLREDP